MADKKTSLIVRMTDGADGVKAKSITNVNPDASLDELKTLAQGLVSLPDRSYVGSTRVEQTDTSYSKYSWEYPLAKMMFGILVNSDKVPLLSEENAGIIGNSHTSYAFHFLNVDNTQGITHENGVYKFDLYWGVPYALSSVNVVAAKWGITFHAPNANPIEGVTFSSVISSCAHGTLQVTIPDTFTQTLTPESGRDVLYNSQGARCARFIVAGQEERSYSWIADFFPYHGGTN